MVFQSFHTFHRFATFQSFKLASEFQSFQKSALSLSKGSIASLRSSCSTGSVMARDFTSKTNCNEVVAHGWLTDPTHGRKLLVGQLGNIGKVNLLRPHASFFLFGSLAAR